ncbi:hypothetical protein [Azospirillum sp. Sh1]|nr:hypothetical protein [Azospirillum sp. Sh1]
MASAPDREGVAKPAPVEQPQRVTRDLRPAKPAATSRGVPYTTKG